MEFLQWCEDVSAPLVVWKSVSSAGLGGTTQSLNASAAPFIPLAYEQSLIDLEALERQTDLKNAALFAIAGFLKRRLQQDAYLEGREMCNQLHMTKP